MGYFISSAFSFFLVMVFIPLVINFSFRYGIFDRNQLVSGPWISRLGGIGVFLSFVIPLVVLITINGEYQMCVFLISLTLLFFLGLYDDLFNLSPFVKLLFQIIIASIAIGYGEISPFNNLFEFPLWNSICSKGLSVLIVVCVINAFNLIDGIDGLATMLGILNVLFTAISLLIYGDHLYATLAFVCCSTLCGFLCFNFSPARIYLGDSGSMIIGFIAVMLAFRLLELDSKIPGYVAGHKMHIFALFIVPLYDAFRVFFIRLLTRKSPFKGDHCHIHHRLRLLGWSDACIVLALTSYTLFMVLLTFVFQGFNDALEIFILLFTAVLTNRVLTYRLQHELTRIRINRNI